MRVDESLRSMSFKRQLILAIAWTNQRQASFIQWIFLHLEISNDPWEGFSLLRQNLLEHMLVSVMLNCGIVSLIVHIALVTRAPAVKSGT